MQLPEPVRDILGNPRYKFAILIILSLLAVFFIYSGDSDAISSIKSMLPEIVATGSVVGAAVETATHANLDDTPVNTEVNIEMLAPFWLFNK